MKISRIVLRPGKALPFYSRHPWVLDSAISHVESAIADGQEVDLISDKGNWIARGLYNSRSRIRVRLYSWQEGEALDKNFWTRRIQAAADLRQSLQLPDSPSGAARMVFSEADRIGGLIVDQFAGHLVVQFTALAMFQRAADIREALQSIFQPLSLGFRTDEAMARREGIDPVALAAAAAGPAEPVTVIEHGLRYRVDLSEGQKTGFYLDQRENRRHAARYVRNARVLDMCCYSGGFTFNALKHGGAREVVAVDTSERAIALARENAALNGMEGAEFRTGDMFRTLEALDQSGERFDTVILDPPRFVRDRAGVQQALRAYHQLNRLGVNILKPGGFLVTCSCSGNVSPEMFEEVLFGVSQRSRREIQILEHHGPAPDHPVSSSCPETRYLKCVIARVL